MTEFYPDDTALLAMTEDDATGVEYIPTGTSPYYLEFRRLIQRSLLAAQRANDLRIYQDGALTIGVRPGRCMIAGDPVAFAGATGIAVNNNATTHVWLDDGGAVATSESGLPADRTTFIPLAEVVTDSGAISQITDLRGEVFLGAPGLGGLGITAAAAEINQVNAGVDPTVTAAALNALTAGVDSSGDAYHHHTQLLGDTDAELDFRLINVNTGTSANAALLFDLPGKLPFASALLPDPATGWLRQRTGAETYGLVGTVHLQHGHGGDLTTSQASILMGVVPIDGVVSDVILTVGQNIVSDNDADGVAATAMVNGVALTDTHPAITDAAGAGFRSTAQGDGTAAAVKADGTEQVSRGDVLTVTLDRQVSGTVTAEASDVVVLIVIRPSKPE